MSDPHWDDLKAADTFSGRSADATVSVMPQQSGSICDPLWACVLDDYDLRWDVATSFSKMTWDSKTTLFSGGSPEDPSERLRQRIRDYAQSNARPGGNGDDGDVDGSASAKMYLEKYDGKKGSTKGDKRTKVDDVEVHRECGRNIGKKDGGEDIKRVDLSSFQDKANATAAPRHSASQERHPKASTQDSTSAGGSAQQTNASQDGTTASKTTSPARPNSKPPRCRSGQKKHDGSPTRKGDGATKGNKVAPKGSPKSPQTPTQANDNEAVISYFLGEEEEEGDRHTNRVRRSFRRRKKRISKLEQNSEDGQQQNLAVSPRSRRKRSRRKMCTPKSKADTKATRTTSKSEEATSNASMNASTNTSTGHESPKSTDPQADETVAKSERSSSTSQFDAVSSHNSSVDAVKQPGPTEDARKATGVLEGVVDPVLKTVAETKAAASASKEPPAAMTMADADADADTTNEITVILTDHALPHETTDAQMVRGTQVDIDDALTSHPLAAVAVAEHERATHDAKEPASAQDVSDCHSDLIGETIEHASSAAMDSSARASSKTSESELEPASSPPTTETDQGTEPAPVVDLVPKEHIRMDPPAKDPPATKSISAFQSQEPSDSSAHMETKAIPELCEISVHETPSEPATPEEAPTPPKQSQDDVPKPLPAASVMTGPEVIDLTDYIFGDDAQGEVQEVQHHSMDPKQLDPPSCEAPTANIPGITPVGHRIESREESLQIASSTNPTQQEAVIDAVRAEAPVPTPPRWAEPIEIAHYEHAHGQQRQQEPKQVVTISTSQLPAQSSPSRSIDIITIEDPDQISTTFMKPEDRLMTIHDSIIRSNRSTSNSNNNSSAQKTPIDLRRRRTIDVTKSERSVSAGRRLTNPRHHINNNTTDAQLQLGRVNSSDTISEITMQSYRTLDTVAKMNQEMNSRLRNIRARRMELVRQREQRVDKATVSEYADMMTELRIPESRTSRSSDDRVSVAREIY